MAPSSISRSTGNHACNGQSPVSVAVVGDKRSSQRGSVSSHAFEAASSVRVVGWKTYSVVGYGQADLIALKVQPHFNLAGSGMQEGIGQRVMRDGEETRPGLRGK